MLVQRPNPRSSGPQRYGVEQLGPAGAGLLPDPQLLQRQIGSALIKLEETGALWRCLPPFWQLPAQQPAGLRAKRVCCLTLSCRVHSSGEQLTDINDYGSFLALKRGYDEIEGREPPVAPVPAAPTPVPVNFLARGCLVQVERWPGSWFCPPR